MITVLMEPSVRAAGDEFELDDDETRHLQVRRVQDGEPVTALDGEGVIVRGVLRKGMRRWQVQAQSVVSTPRHAPTVIAVAAGDRDRFMWVVEKCAELNVTRVIPLITARQHNVENRLREAGVDKARKRAREACKQCGNPWTPIVDDVTALADLATGGRWYIADAAGSRLQRVGPKASIGWIIGPEGGLTTDEAAMATERLAATAVSFGPNTLRFETAAVVAATLTLDRRMSTGQGSS